ncbi:MAG: NADH:flavin oxidoreductase, partial [Actinomycetota bacterium]|nr:NADH:flavin oxidoreductase [Actinomycetota bacterium]
MSEKFPNLFGPAKIGGCELRNRLIMSLYPTKYPADGQVNDRYVEFWRARAKGGVAMIVLDGACLDYPAAYKGGPELRMDTDAHAAGLKRLLQAVQGEGAMAFMQLNYPAGLACEAGTPGAVEKKGRWMLPLVGGATEAKLKEIAETYGAGAAKARRIGYDGVEVQASWGDLVAQFLSPLSNKRTDGYGGSLANRARFLLEIVAAVKRSAGDDYPLQIKFVADELVAGGFGLDEAKPAAKELEAAGVDAILVNVGNKKTKKQTLPPHSLPPGVFVSFAAAIKSAVNIPVIAMGKINTPALAEEILAGGQA